MTEEKIKAKILFDGCNAEPKGCEIEMNMPSSDDGYTYVGDMSIDNKEDYISGESSTLDISFFDGGSDFNENMLFYNRIAGYKIEIYNKETLVGCIWSNSLDKMTFATTTSVETVYFICYNKMNGNTTSLTSYGDEIYESTCSTDGATLDLYLELNENAIEFFDIDEFINDLSFKLYAVRSKVYYGNCMHEM